ncbi:unnamed protein product, partial [Discosporangium mesarthrocarpum]
MIMEGKAAADEVEEGEITAALEQGKEPGLPAGAPLSDPLSAPASPASAANAAAAATPGLSSAMTTAAVTRLASGGAVVTTRSTWQPITGAETEWSFAPALMLGGTGAGVGSIGVTAKPLPVLGVVKDTPAPAVAPTLAPALTLAKKSRGKKKKVQHTAPDVAKGSSSAATPWKGT